MQIPTKSFKPIIYSTKLALLKSRGLPILDLIVISTSSTQNPKDYLTSILLRALIFLMFHTATRETLYNEEEELSRSSLEARQAQEEAGGYTPLVPPHQYHSWVVSLVDWLASHANYSCLPNTNSYTSSLRSMFHPYIESKRKIKNRHLHVCLRFFKIDFCSKNKENNET